MSSRWRSFHIRHYVLTGLKSRTSAGLEAYQAETELLFTAWSCAWKTCVAFTKPSMWKMSHILCTCCVHNVPWGRGGSSSHLDFGSTARHSGDVAHDILGRHRLPSSALTAVEQTQTRAFYLTSASFFFSPLLMRTCWRHNLLLWTIFSLLLPKWEMKFLRFAAPNSWNNVSLTLHFQTRPETSSQLWWNI